MRRLILVLTVILCSIVQGSMLVDSVVISGATSVPEAAALFAVRKGDSTTEAMIGNAFARFREAYEKEAALSCGFLLSTTQDSLRGSCTITITVSEGAWVRSLALAPEPEESPVPPLRLLYHKEGGPFADDSLQGDMRRMRSWYADRSLTASITVETMGAREKRIVFAITLRPAHARLLFAGTRFFDQATLAAAAAETDPIPALRRLYHTQGFFAVSFDSQSRDSVTTITITECARSPFASVLMVGNDKIPPDTLLSYASFKRGEPFSEERVTGIIQAMLAWYENHGFPFCEISPREFTYGPEGVIVSLAISEKGRYHFGNLYVYGAATTKPGAITRLAGFREGSLFSQTELLKLTARLARSSLFETVEEPRITVQQGRRVADVHIRVVEGSHNSAEGMVGYAPGQEGDGENRFSGYAHLALGNIAGTCRSLSFDYLRETPVLSGDFRYREPWVLGSRISAEGAFSYHTDEAEAYTIWETGVRIVVPFSDQVTFSTGIAQSANTYRDTGSFFSTDRTYATLAGITIDARDFPDNPRSGYFLELPVRYGRKRGSTGVFNEAAFSANAEYILPMGRTQALYCKAAYRTLASNDPTLNRGELFPLGGALTVRGYRENQFYGKTIAFARTEYRFLEGLRSRFALFFDLGATADRPAIFREVSARNLLFGYGAGFSLKTKAGLLGIDYGLARNSPVLEGKIHLNIKNSF